MSKRNCIASCLVVVLVAACSGNTNAPQAAEAQGQAPVTAPQPAPQTPPRMQPPAPIGEPATDAPAFAGKVWKVVESSGVQAGTTYAFLADGTLVIESGPGNPPGHGKWTYVDGKLSIEEEGIEYPTDIVSSDADHLELRSHNPGGTLDIKLERVPDAKPL